MNEDITLNPSAPSQSSFEKQRQEMSRDYTRETKDEQQMLMNAAKGIRCPHCGTVNSPNALFCESCGNPLGKTSCPNCGAELDPDADFCESCRRYIKQNVCSFCGANLSGNEAFCPECGSPRGGIVCPVCHTLNDFAFCKRCGTALTEEAHLLMEKIHHLPEFIEMQQLSSELQHLEQTIPYTSDRELVIAQQKSAFREHVLTLLAQDRGVAHPDIPKVNDKQLSQEDYEKKKKAYLEQLASLLDKMAQQPQPRPAQVRNYAMAFRPQGVRLAWECNFKHALHSSPCGCAKPQLGGKWIILGKDSRKEIKDDK